MTTAFTLIELLVVMVIIGILAAIGLPAMRGMSRSNATIAANRQLLDDLTYARQRAIGDHTTVFVVFVPPSITSYLTTFTPAAIPGLPPALYRQYTNLLTGQYTTYALFTRRQLGAQPGQMTPKYLTDWRKLPNGVFIAVSKYVPQVPPTPPVPLPAPLFPTNSALTFPFPSISPFQMNLQLPYLAFNYLGQLVVLDPFLNEVPAADMDIPLARGSIFYDPATFLADLQESPAGNSISNAPPNYVNSMYNDIHINALTGRAQVQQPSIQ